MENIKGTDNVIIYKKYADFKRQYEEMKYQTEKFVSDEVDKLDVADSTEKSLRCIEFKTKVFPSEKFKDEVESLVYQFIMQYGKPFTVKQIGLARVFYIIELLKLKGILTDSNEIMDCFNHIFCHKDFKINSNYIEYTKISSDVFESLHEYTVTYNRYKAVVDGVDNNIEIKDSLSKVLMELSLIKIIADPESFEKPEEGK